MPENNTSSAYGLEAWCSRRKEWTTADESIVQEKRTSSPALHLNDDQKISTYHSLILERRSFSRPIPLGAVVDIVVHGWKQNGTWPTDEQAPL
ncbi:hypothetical protein [Absidia glauca]|uniref:Gag1-like clamp domain-containing protein n=1 Tax=Absidia glauca TaxID=4829 RepID=A0A168SLN3_ABSGL|nr:hypothetical protein [Absidia glauca]